MGLGLGQQRHGLAALRPAARRVAAAFLDAAGAAKAHGQVQLAWGHGEARAGGCAAYQWACAGAPPDRRCRGAARPPFDVGDREVPGLGHQPGIGQRAAHAAPVAGSEGLQQARVQHVGGQPLPLQASRSPATTMAMSRRSRRVVRARFSSRWTSRPVRLPRRPIIERTRAVPPAVSKTSRPGDAAGQDHPLDATAQCRGYSQA